MIIIGVDPGSTTDLAELLEDPRIMTEVLGGAK